jgi:hypothetical protein
MENEDDVDVSALGICWDDDFGADADDEDDDDAAVDKFDDADVKLEFIGSDTGGNESDISEESLSCIDKDSFSGNKSAIVELSVLRLLLLFLNSSTTA